MTECENKPKTCITCEQPLETHILQRLFVNPVLNLDIAYRRYDTKKIKAYFCSARREGKICHTERRHILGVTCPYFEGQSLAVVVYCKRCLLHLTDIRIGCDIGWFGIASTVNEKRNYKFRDCEKDHPPTIVEDWGKDYAIRCDCGKFHFLMDNNLSVSFEAESLAWLKSWLKAIKAEREGKDLAILVPDEKAKKRREGVEEYLEEKEKSDRN